MINPLPPILHWLVAALSLTQVRGGGRRGSSDCPPPPREQEAVPARGEFHDQGDAKWIVIKGQLRGHNHTPFGRPGVGRPSGVFGGFSYYQSVISFSNIVPLITKFTTSMRRRHRRPRRPPRRHPRNWPVCSHAAEICQLWDEIE
jgi:hypothetical protein